jgi:hypothetical protein
LEYLHKIEIPGIYRLPTFPWIHRISHFTDYGLRTGYSSYLCSYRPISGFPRPENFSFNGIGLNKKDRVWINNHIFSSKSIPEKWFCRDSNFATVSANAFSSTFSALDTFLRHHLKPVITLVKQNVRSNLMPTNLLVNRLFFSLSVFF